MKKITDKYILILCLVVGGLTACKKGLDYQDTTAITPGNVWSSPALIRAYLTDVYGGSMPGWDLGSAQSSDEGFSSEKSMGEYQRGIIGVEKTTASLNYTIIDKVNHFLDQLATLPTTVLDAETNKRFQGEAKFWRAWSYWGMVQNLGGVPLILHTQNPNDKASLRVPRNKTSECIAQMVKDLDSAALLLPVTYTDAADYGRITKLAALGLKGRILLWYASPLFNPNNDQARWTAALAATKAAADAAGYDLFPNYRGIWYSANKEQIMVHQYDFDNKHYANFAYIRPQPFTNGATDNNRPCLPLLLAYPKRDGSPMEFDATRLDDPAYGDQLLTDFYTNRDDRFYASIFPGGTVYPTMEKFSIADPAPTTFWMAFAKSSRNVYDSNMNQAVNGYPCSRSSFYDRKGLDTTLTANQVWNGAKSRSWWAPMRHAELLLNYAECANEAGDQSIALEMLKLVRKRAGITVGTGNYGITAASQAEFRTAIMNERQVEFAFENFRLPDLRRWKKYDILNSLPGRQLLLLVLKDNLPFPSKTDNIMDATVRAKFKFLYVPSLDNDAAYRFNLDLNHWFYAIPPAQISKEPDVLFQNNEWGGTFDPLQ